jgi:hypothetical protein
MKNKNHVTVGVYSNDTFKRNVVAPEDLDGHIDYNKKMRPGRALFVDSKCVHQGYLSEKETKEWEVKIKEMNISSGTVSKVYV